MVHWTLGGSISGLWVNERRHYLIHSLHLFNHFYWQGVLDLRHGYARWSFLRFFHSASLLACIHGCKIVSEYLLRWSQLKSWTIAWPVRNLSSFVSLKVCPFLSYLSSSPCLLLDVFLVVKRLNHATMIIMLLENKNHKLSGICEGFICLRFRIALHCILIQDRCYWQDWLLSG